MEDLIQWSHRIYMLGYNREEGRVGGREVRDSGRENRQRLLQSSRFKLEKAKPKAMGMSWEK